MAHLEHTSVSDRERLFYDVEARFVDLSVQHYRALATISATELGFLLTSLTLAGTNELARSFVTQNSIYGAPVAVLLLLSVVMGSLCGRFSSLNLLYGSRAEFIPSDARVKLSKSDFTEEQTGELLNITDTQAKKLKKRFKSTYKLTSFTSLLTTLCFATANLIVILLILTNLPA